MSVIFAGVKSITIPEGSVKEIRSGSTVLWKAGRLPAGLTEVEWVSNTGASGAYIDTEYMPCQDTRIEFTVKDVTGYWFGAGSTPRVAVSKNSNNSQYYLRSNAASDIIDVVGSYPTKSEIILQCGIASRYVEVDGVKTENTSRSVAFRCTGSLRLFAWQYSTTTLRTGSATVYGVKIYESGSLLRNLVPCREAGSGRIGFFDLVTEDFFPGLGSGSLTAGPDV